MKDGVGGNLTCDCGDKVVTRPGNAGTLETCLINQPCVPRPRSLNSVEGGWCLLVNDRLHRMRK